MDSSLHAELNALRSRAYGRSADSTLDPDLVRRLEELEARAREDGQLHLDRPVTSTERPAPPENASITSSRVPSETLTSDVAPPVPTRERRSPRRPGRLMMALWAASVATSAAVAASATFAAVSILPVAVSNDAPQIAALEPDPEVKVPVGFFGAGASSAAYEFSGLTLFETTSNVFGSGDGRGECFVAALSSDIPEEMNSQSGISASGPFYSGCRAGKFPATITVTVDSSAPPELRTRFPDGALQFIKDGDRIGVFLGTVEE